MGMKLIITFVVSVTCLNLYSQVNPGAANLRYQAEKMGEAFVSSDYDTYVKYIYPKIIEISGGKERLKALLKETVFEMDKEGMKFQKITFDESSKIIKIGSQLQCTLQQHTEVKLQQGRVVATSTLIALSNNNGLNWFFVDTNNKDMALLKKMIPNLGSDIIIPPQAPAVRYND